jgi:hypothetical protein
MDIRGSRACHPSPDPIIHLQFIQLKQEILYLEILSMSSFLQILVGAVVMVNRIVSRDVGGLGRTVQTCASFYFVECIHTFLSGISGISLRQRSIYI